MSTANNVAFESRYAPVRFRQMDILLTPTWTPIDLLINTTYTFCFIPAGAMVVAIGFVFGAMDINITPLLSFDLGDSGSATRYLSADTTARAGGSITTSTSVTPYYYSADDNLVLKVHAGAATAALLAIRAYVNYSLDGVVG